MTVLIACATRRSDKEPAESRADQAEGSESSRVHPLEATSITRVRSSSMVRSGGRWPGVGKATPRLASYRPLAAADDKSGPGPTPIAGEAQTFTVRHPGANTAASRFRGLFADSTEPKMTRATLSASFPCPLSPVSCLLSPVSCLLPPVSCLLSPDFYLLTCLTSVKKGTKVTCNLSVTSCKRM
jgi:hypothetical protein